MNLNSSDSSSTELIKMPSQELAALPELTPLDKMIAVGIKQLSVRDGKLPSTETLAEFLGLEASDIAGAFSKESFQAMTSQLGIPMESDRDSPNPRKVLTPIQVMVADAVLNPMDKRSIRQKLGEFGIKPATWQGWMTHNRPFIDYVNKKAGDDIGKIDYITNVKLTEMVADGDITAIKLVKELNGQLDKRLQIDFNINLFVVKLVEIIQIHVSSPEERNAIATAVEALAVEFIPKGMK